MKFQPRTFEQSFNNLASDLFFQAPSIYRNGATNRAVGHTVPANILKTEVGYELELAVPGFDKEAFQISLEKGILTVSAEHNTDTEANKEAFVRREFRRQSFKRSWTIDETIDTASIAARYSNGILTLTLPRKTEAQEPVQRINIQ